MSTNPAPATAVAAPPPTEKYNPLGEKVIEKSYANSNASAFSQQDLTSDLGEPTFTPPPAESNEIPRREEKKEKKEVKEEPKPFNPGLEDLPEGEKTDRARQAAVALISGYEMINNGANQWIKIPEKKIQKLQMAGEIDVNMSVPYEIGSEISLAGFIKEFNSQCDDVCTVDEQFKKDLTPPLTRVLAKRGHGLSDEQQIVFIVGKHAATNMFKCWQMMVASKSILDFAKEQKAAQKQRPPSMRPVPQEPVYEPPPVQQQQQEAPVVNMSEMTLQERAMAQHQHNINGGTAPTASLPVFGDEKKIEGINKIQAKDLRDQEVKIKNSRRIQQAKKENLLSNVPKAGKKRGPKIGSKRIKKN